MRKVVCVLGPQLAGKNFLVDTMVGKYPCLKWVYTHTEREPRYVGEPGHIFHKDLKQAETEYGKMDIIGVVPGNKYRTGLRFVDIEGVDKSKVPLISTATGEVAGYINSKYPDNFGIYIDIDPLTASDRNNIRSEFNRSMIASASIHEEQKHRLRIARKGCQLEILGDMLFSPSCETNFNLVDKPIDIIMAEIGPAISDYLKK